MTVNTLLQEVSTFKNFQSHTWRSSLCVQDICNF